MVFVAFVAFETLLVLFAAAPDFLDDRFLGLTCSTSLSFKALNEGPEAGCRQPRL
jgi:hypothetical protein